MRERYIRKRYLLAAYIMMATVEAGDWRRSFEVERGNSSSEFKSGLRRDFTN